MSKTTKTVRSQSNGTKTTKTKVSSTTGRKKTSRGSSVSVQNVKTQKNLEKNLKSLTSTKVRKTRIDKKPVFTKVKSGDLWELGNGNGNIKNTMPWYLHPVQKDTFNRSWFRDYDDACKQIARLKLRPEQYTLTKYNG
mgnify:FL=1